MADFYIHFFKEKSRSINIENLIAFFDRIEGVDVEMDETSVRFFYTNPKLGYQAKFLITPKSQVPNIYRLNPKYLDINFHLEVPILTPDFPAKEVFEITRRLSEQFGFYIYSEFFEDVLPFKMEVVLKVFDMVKKAYIEKNPILLKDYFEVPKERLSSVLRYKNDIQDLQFYYKDLSTYVPDYLLLKDEYNKLLIAIEWKDGTLTVFPPEIDYIFYKLGNMYKIIPYEMVSELMDKHLLSVPGFIKNTKVIPKKTSKKVYKIVKKIKVPKINNNFIRVELDKLID